MESSSTEAIFSQLLAVVPGDSESIVDMFGIDFSMILILWNLLVESCLSIIGEDAQPKHMLVSLAKLRMDLPSPAIEMLFGMSEAEVSKYMWRFIKAIGHLGGSMVCDKPLSCVLLHLLHLFLLIFAISCVLLRPRMHGIFPQMIGQDNSLASAPIRHTLFVSGSNQFVYDVSIFIQTGDIIVPTSHGPVSSSNFFGRFGFGASAPQDGHQDTDGHARARQEVTIRRIRQFIILQNPHLNSDHHATAFRAVVVLVQLRL